MISFLEQLEFRQGWFAWASLLGLVVFLISFRPATRVVFSSVAILPKSTRTWRTALSWLPDLLVALAVGLLGLALAGPRLSDKDSKVRREGIAIMMVVDLSSSMLALDLSEGEDERNRLEAVQDVFADFVRGNGDLAGRSDDAVGIVSFARYADTRCPLTFDHDIVLGIANDLEITSARNEDGTAIGDALSLAVERLRQSKANSRVAILLTDGVNNIGAETPAAAAQLAKNLGIKVYTIGAGTTGIAKIKYTDPRTGQEYLRRERVMIDEETLKLIAKETNGRYFRATDSATLREIYGDIDRLERTVMEEESYRSYRELYRWAIGLALLLAALGYLLRASVFRRLPC